MSGAPKLRQPTGWGEAGFLPFAFLCCWFCVISSDAAEPETLRGRAMGTTWSVKFLQPVPALDTNHVVREVEQLLERLEQQFSTYRPASELSRFNTSHETNWFTVAPDLALVAGEARAISELTGGAFDVTVEPLVQLWGFGAHHRPGSLPTGAEITAARSRVDWRQLESRSGPPALRKLNAGLTGDFSSMAKGFAADAISQWLVAQAAGNHLVQVGGDVKSGGHGADGSGWRTAIEQPLDEARGIECFLMLNGQALSTSGDYRNYFTAAGKRYGHIIDPRTGWPATGPLASVSVVHPKCAWSSALATGLFALGAEDGWRVATSNQLACLFLIRDGRGTIRKMTPEFERLLAK